MLEVLVRQSRFKLPEVVDLHDAQARRHCSGSRPARSPPGAPADVCLFDPDEEWRYDAKAGFSKSSNSPWHGRTLTGRVKTTIVDGRVVFPLAAS